MTYANLKIIEELLENEIALVDEQLDELKARYDKEVHLEASPEWKPSYAFQTLKESISNARARLSELEDALANLRNAEMK